MIKFVFLPTLSLHFLSVSWLFCDCNPPTIATCLTRSSTSSPKLMLELQKPTLNKLVPFARAVTSSSRIVPARFSFLIYLSVFLLFYFRSVCILFVSFNSVLDYFFGLNMFQIYACLFYECWFRMNCFFLFNSVSELFMPLIWMLDRNGFFVCVSWFGLFSIVFLMLWSLPTVMFYVFAAVNFTSECGNK